MTRRLYNTLTRSVQPFTPLDALPISVYVCGPTVYDVPHLGHARSAFIFDVLRRHLARTYRDVEFVRNVTDVDDKIIEKARQELGVSSQQSAVSSQLKDKCVEVAEKYLASYHAAMDQLGLQRPTSEPRATEHIDAMLDCISQLLMDGIAYEAGDGVYFAVRAFQGYGHLSNRSPDELQAGARVEPWEHKRDPLDFALWKKAKSGEPSWNSPWGPGRPGWHIECSAMSMKFLGNTFDIHGGGLDLIFPHHENEIAQAQAAGKPFARCWVHNGLLTVNGEKMSKSLGNYITVEQALKDAGHVDALKMFFLSGHYRSPLDYTKSTVEAAARRWDGLWGFLDQVKRAEQANTRSDSSDSAKGLQGAEDRFWQAMDDDLNTPKALASLDRLVEIGFQWVGLWDKKTEELEAKGKHPEDDEGWLGLRENIMVAGNRTKQLGAALGLTFRQEDFTAGLRVPTDDDKKLLEAYKTARKKRDFPKSDELRRQLIERGFAVQDRGSDSSLVPKR